MGKQLREPIFHAYPDCYIHKNNLKHYVRDLYKQWKEGNLFIESFISN